MFNPLQMLMGMNNPQQIVNMMMSNPNTAQYAQMAQQLTKGKTMKEIEAVATNLARQRGMSMEQVNQAMQQFMSGNMKF